MSPDDTYNGWSNRETWAAALVIDNDEPTYTAARDIVDQYKNLWRLAQALQDWVEDLCTDPTWELAWLRDVGSTWRIDWHEIAEAWSAE